jgi:pilus assembly protein Flp/PilA
VKFEWTAIRLEGIRNTGNRNLFGKDELEFIYTRADSLFYFNSRDFPMRRFCQLFRIFVRNEDGPTSVEYAVMLALIVLVCMSAIKTLGSNTKTTYTNLSGSLGS